jgi:hypothetical protein
MFEDGKVGMGSPFLSPPLGRWPCLVCQGLLDDRAAGSMLCWRWVEEGVDQLEYLGVAGRVGGRVVREGGAVGAAGGR